MVSQRLIAGYATGLPRSVDSPETWFKTRHTKVRVRLALYFRCVIRPRLLPVRAQIVDLAEVIGEDAKSARGRSKLIDAFRALELPVLSFSGIRSIGSDFIAKALAPALIESARAGRPVMAREVEQHVARVVHPKLRDIGVLLPIIDEPMVLGCSPKLSLTLTEVRSGRDSARTLRAALGISEVAAASHLELLEFWGIVAAAAPPEELPLAA